MSLTAIGLFLACCAGPREAEATEGESAVTAPQEEQPRDTTAQTPESAETPLTFAFVGDIMMGTTYPTDGHYLTADDGATLFKDAAEILRRVDIAAGNLEGSLFDGEGTPKRCIDPNTCYTFKMPERYSQHLVDAGFDFVGLANNHINDFGPEAIEATQRVLNEAGIAYAGVSGKCPTAIVERDGRKIGFAAFGFNPGMPSIIDMEEVKRLVGDLRKSSDIVVVCFHGGGEGASFQHVPHATEHAFGQNRGDVEKFAHTAIDAGADVIYGHSPHVSRGMELYKDRIILYSLGNFCTPYKFNLSGVNGYAPIAEVTLNPDGTFAQGRIHSFIQQRGVGPRTDTHHSAARTMKRLSYEDFPKTAPRISDTGEIVK